MSPSALTWTDSFGKLRFSTQQRSCHAATPHRTHDYAPEQSTHRLSPGKSVHNLSRNETQSVIPKRVSYQFSMRTGGFAEDRLVISLLRAKGPKDDSPGQRPGLIVQHLPLLLKRGESDATLAHRMGDGPG